MEISYVSPLRTTNALISLHKGTVPFGPLLILEADCTHKVNVETHI